MRTKILTVAIAMTALAIPATVTAAPSGPGPGNAPNAKSCQKNGWTQLVRSDGTAFTSEEQCTSYAAGGGVLQPKSPTAQQICEDAGGTFQSGGNSVFNGGPLVWSCSGALSAATITALANRCYADGGSQFGVLENPPPPRGECIV